MHDGIVSLTGYLSTPRIQSPTFQPLICAASLVFQELGFFINLFLNFHLQKLVWTTIWYTVSNVLKIANPNKYHHFWCIFGSRSQFCVFCKPNKYWYRSFPKYALMLKGGLSQSQCNGSVCSVWLTQSTKLITLTLWKTVNWN